MDKTEFDYRSVFGAKGKNMHVVVTAKIELRASVSMVQYPGRTRKVVHLISNTRLPLFLPLPNCLASSSKIHMLTHPRYVKPHHTISVAVLFHMLVSLPQKNVSAI